MFEHLFEAHEGLRESRKEMCGLSDNARAQVRSVRERERCEETHWGEDAVGVIRLSTAEMVAEFGVPVDDGSVAPELRNTPLLDRLAPEVRNDGFVTVQGYGSIFDHGYLFADAFGLYVEQMDAKAFDASLERGSQLRVSLLIGHRGIGLAEGTAGRMRVGKDERGLGFVASLNMAETDSKDLVEKLRTGSATTDTSVGGRIDAMEWNDDYTVGTITDWSLREISVVNQGANPAGYVMLRSETPQGVRCANLSDIEFLEQRKSLFQSATGVVDE